MPIRTPIWALGLVAVVMVALAAAQTGPKAGGVEVLEGTWKGAILVRATNTTVGVRTKVEKDGSYVSEPLGSGRWVSKGVFKGQDGKFTWEATTTNPDNRNNPVAQTSGIATLEVVDGKEVLTVTSSTTGNTGTSQREK